MTDNLAPARVVMRAGALGTTTQVVFEINRRFLWIGHKSIVLARGSFRGDPDFLLVEEALRPLVFELLGDEENTDVVKLGFGVSYVELILTPSAAGDLETYVAKMRTLLADAFDLDFGSDFEDEDGEYGTPRTAFLVTEKFGPMGKSDPTTQAIAQGWGGTVHRVADDEALAAHIRRAKVVSGI